MTLLILLACSGKPEPTRARPEHAAAPAARVEAILLARHPELRTSGGAELATETVGGIRRAGLRIDAGAEVTYTVTIPEKASLGFEVGTLGEATGTSQLEIDVTRDGAKAARRVRHVRAAHAAHDRAAQVLQQFLDR